MRLYTRWGGATGVQAADGTEEGTGEETEEETEAASQAVNLAGLDGVSVTATEDGTDSNQADTTNGRPVSNLLTSDSANWYDTYDITAAAQAVTIDLGEGMEATAESIVVYNHAKAYSTSYTITTSSDGEKWTDVAACSDTDGQMTTGRIQVVTDADNATSVVDSGVKVGSFTGTSIGRYVKFTFAQNSKNSQANWASHIAIQQIVINGVVKEAEVIAPSLSVTAPAAGAAIADVSSADEDAKYSVTTAWYEGTTVTENAMAAEATFSSGVSYTVQATLTINDGEDCIFDADYPAALTAAGESPETLEADVAVLDDGTTMTVTYTFLSDADQITAAKAELYNLYLTYGSLSEDDYTSDSWSTLESAALSAYTVYTNEAATLADVNSAIASVTAAIGNLVKLASDIVISDVSYTAPVAGDYAAPASVTMSGDSSAHGTLADYTDDPATLTERSGTTTAYAYADGIWGFVGQWTDSATTGTKFDVYGDTQMVLRFMLLPDEDGTGNVQLVGKMDHQYGVQIEYSSNSIIAYSHNSNDGWPEVAYTWSDDSFLTEWHEVLLVYTGSKIMLYVDGEAGVADNSTRPNYGTDSAELQEWDSCYFTIGYNWTKAQGDAEASFLPMTEGLLADVQLYSGTLGLSDDNYTNYSVITNLIEAEDPAANVTITPYDVQTVWTDAEGSVLGAEDGYRYAGLTVYTATTTFTAHEGYKFTQATAPVVDGATVTVSDDGLTMTVTKTFEATAELVCACEIGDITATSPVTAALGTSGTATVTLSASATISGDCKIHDDPEVTYTYEVTTALEGTETSIDGSSLTVTSGAMTANQTGSITVTVTASPADQDSTAESRTATITVNVTSDKATADAIAELQAEANKADGLTGDGYTEDSWSDYQSALAAAQAVLAKDNPSAAEVAAALEGLQSAQAALKLQEEVDADDARATLDALKAQLDALNSSDYTTESYNAAVDAWNAAVLLYNDQTTSAADLQAAADKVQAALDALVTTAQAEAAAKAAAQSELDAALAAAKAIIDAGQGSYTAETWNALTAAYAAASSPAADATSADLKTLLTNLTTAQAGLKTQTASTSTVPQKGDVVESGNYNYRVTGDDTVEVLDLTAKGKKQKKLKIYNTVKLGGKTFKVTSIAAKALKGQKKVTTLTIGKNITSIGAKAFYGCTKLKKVTVKSKVLKSVGKAAFKKTSANLKVKVPRARKKAYTKLLKKGGVKASKVK